MNLTENLILIGLGGIGKVLKAFCKRLFSEFNTGERNQLLIVIDFAYSRISIESNTLYIYSKS